MARDVGYDACSYDVREAAWTDHSGRTIQVALEPNTDDEGSRMPRQISVELEEMSATLEIQYRVVDTEMNIGEDAFAFSCPAGTRVVQMPCDGEESRDESR